MSDFEPPGSGQQPDQPATPPGWYTDPWDPQAMRWWDGANWGAQTTAGSPTAPNASPTNTSGLSDVGSWIGETFRLATRRAGHIFTIAMATVLPGSIALTLTAWAASADLQVEKTAARRSGSAECVDDPLAAGCWPSYDFTGWDSSWLVPLALAAAFSLLMYVLASVSIAHQMHAAADDTPATWSESLIAGVRNVPRWLLFGLLAALSFLGLIVVSSVVGGAASPALGFLLGIVSLPLMLLLWVKFSFVTVASAVAPKRTNLLAASWRISTDTLMPILGRLIVLFTLWIAMSFAGNIVTAPISSIASAGIDQEQLADIVDVSGPSGVWGIRDLLGSPAPMALGTILNTVVQIASLAVVLSGLALLYRQRGGPATERPSATSPPLTA